MFIPKGYPFILIQNMSFFFFFSQSNLAEEHRKREVSHWSSEKRMKVYILRFTINILVVAALFGCFYLIYKVVNIQLEVRLHDYFLVFLLLCVRKYYENRFLNHHKVAHFASFLSMIIIKGKVPNLISLLHLQLVIFMYEYPFSC